MMVVSTWLLKRRRRRRRRQREKHQHKEIMFMRPVAVEVVDCLFAGWTVEFRKA